MIIQNSWTLDSFIEAYKQYQRRVRGLRERTLQGYELLLRPFLRFSLGQDPLDPMRLNQADVVRFVISSRDRFSPRTMKLVRTALRSLFPPALPQPKCYRTAWLVE
jgi:site-specific recombinase XerC